MVICASFGSDCYLGNMLHSLEYLPRWYQIIALFGVVFLFPFREIVVVAWLAASLHYPFGTEALWSDRYQRLLEQMSFSERLCFALYGVALSTFVLFAYCVFGREASQMLAQETGLSEGRKWWPAVAICVAFGCEGMAILKEEVERTLFDSKLLSHLALDDFQRIEKSGFDLLFVQSNPHFLIQLEILKALLSSFFKKVGPAAILACGYRLVRDVPRKAHAALRWYIVTLMLSRSLITISVMYRQNEWRKQSSWILLALTLIFLGIVNYIFGPSKRGGWTEATSVLASINKTVQAVVMCTAILFLSHLSVLALVVSIHVVELLLVWLIFFLVTVWIPAIIDSCSTNYIFSIVAAISFVAHKMEYLTDWGCIRLWILLSVWWLDLCLLYNMATNICRSRYGGIVALSLLAVGVGYMSERGGGTGDFVSLLENNAAVLRGVVEGTASLKGTVFVGYSAMSTLFAALLQIGAVIGGVLVSSTALLSVFESREVRARLLDKKIVIVTPGVLFRKLVKSLIFGVCFFIFVMAGLLMYHVVPQLAMFVPDFVALGMALGMACTILGSLMDMQEFLYVGFMRLIGVLDPPVSDDEERELDAAMFEMECRGGRMEAQFMT